MLIFSLGALASEGYSINLLSEEKKESKSKSTEKYSYEITLNIDEISEKVREVFLEIKKSKNSVLKTLYTKINTIDNRDGEIKDPEGRWGKIYQLRMDYDKDGRIKTTREKVYVIDLGEHSAIMYIPLKEIKKKYRYFTPKEKENMENFINGEIKIEKFYRKIFYGSGEKSSIELEKMIKEIIPESDIENYNSIDYGFYKDVINNNDEEEIFFRGTIEF